MAFTFDVTIALGRCDNAVLAHEPDGGFWKYCIMDGRLENSVSFPLLGLYDGLSFAKKPSVITAKMVRDIGMKNLPGIGAYGYFTLLHQDTSYVAYPIHHTNETIGVPLVTIVDLGGNNFHFTIVANYEAFRIELISGYFTEERIVYAIDGIAEITISPELSGELLVYVTGYSEEISVASKSWQGSITV